MKEFIGKNVLATCDAWFYAPDGADYKAVYGKLEAIQKISEDTLGFTPNRPNVNWVYKIGNMFIQGCQIKYMMVCESKPSFGKARGWMTHDGALVEYERPTIIYDAS